MVDKETIERLTYEEAMEKLEETVALLEQGDMPLEKSLELFQTGVSLASVLNKKLDETEKKLVFLSKSPDGTMEEQQLTEEDGDDI